MSTGWGKLWGWGAVLGLVVGCGGTESADVEAADDELRLVAPKVTLTIRESNMFFTSEPESFQFEARGMSLPCKDDSFFLSGDKSLYDHAWSTRDEKFYGGTDPMFRIYGLASCRDAATSARGWFTKDPELSVSEMLLSEDYNASERPLLVQIRSLASRSESYVSCSTRTRTLLDTTDAYKRYRIDMTCRPTRKPLAKAKGILDFLDASGPGAAIQSYKVWPHPQVPSTQAAFAAAKAALFEKVEPGMYTGVMSTLGKTCHLRVDAPSPGKLIVEHTIDSSNRTRRLEVSEKDLLGTLSGELYKDPLGVGEEPVGTFASIEVRGEGGKTHGVRFEKNNTLDGAIVRINGPETYCRRLVKVP